MKKFICFLLFIFLSVLPIFADDEQQNIQIEKIKGTPFSVKKCGQYYELTDSRNNKETVIVPSTSEYDNFHIKRKSFRGKKLVILKFDNDRYYSWNKLYLIYSPDKAFADLLTNYIELSNQNQNIIFKNYPKNGTIKYITYRLDPAHETAGYIQILDDEVIKITSDNCAWGRVIYTKSLINMILSVYYPPFSTEEMRFNKVYDVPFFIDEDVKIENGKLIITYKDMDNTVLSEENKNFINEKNKKFSYKDKEKLSDSFENGKINMHKLFSDLCSNKDFCFQNYPLNGIMYKLVHNNTFNIWIIENGKAVEKIPDNYSNVYPYSVYNDAIMLNKIIRNPLFYFPSNENIIVKQKNSDRTIPEKWGIIDKNNNIKVPFVYDLIIPINEKSHETVNIKNGKVYINYIQKNEDKNNNNLYIVKKDSKYGVINDKNEIIVPIEFINLSKDYSYGLIENLSYMKRDFYKKHSLGQSLENMRRDTGEAIREFSIKIFLYVAFFLFGWI